MICVSWLLHLYFQSFKFSESSRTIQRSSCRLFWSMVTSESVSRSFDVLCTVSGPRSLVYSIQLIAVLAVRRLTVPLRLISTGGAGSMLGFLRGFGILKICLLYSFISMWWGAIDWDLFEWNEFSFFRSNESRSPTLCKSNDLLCSGLWWVDKCFIKRYLCFGIFWSALLLV